MFKKSLIVLMIGCFLLGMATKAEVEGVKEEAEKGVVLDSDIEGNWTNVEIEYFRNKEYVGDKERYTPYSIDYFPPYLKGEIEEELKKYGTIGNEDLKKIIEEGKASKVKLLRYYNLLSNEMYARKGYIFEGADLKEFFGRINWYKPGLKRVELNKRERKNLKEIKKLEEIVKNTKVISELFSKQVIIKARWGKGPGEFALEPLPESYEYRTSFTIDDYGNIYIEDPNNQRINVFSKNGAFIKSVNIPERLIHSYQDEKTSLVEGIGVDKNRNIYLASSSTTELLTSGSSGEVVFKIDENGKGLDSLTFKGYYISPAIFYESDNVMYLWGSWEGGITAGVPLEFGGMERVTQLNFKHLRDNSFDQSRKSVTLGTRRIKINYDEAPVVFNKSRDSRVVFYERRNFVFQDANGEIREEISSNSECFRYYPLGYGFLYKGHNIIVSTWPYIDKNLNIYCIDGTKTHLHLIKFIPTYKIWQ